MIVASRPTWQSGYASPGSTYWSRAAYPELWRGCVGAWCPSLGPTGGTLFDHSGYRNHGTLTNMDPGTDWVVSGRGGYALDFDGVNDHIAAGNAPIDISNVLTQPFSMASWAFIRNWKGGSPATEKCANWVAIGSADYNAASFSTYLGKTSFIGGTGSSWVVGATPPIGSTVLSLGQWYHVAVTRNTSGVYTVYVNGVPDGTVTQTTNLGLNNQAIKFGCHYALHASYMSDGILNDIRIYNRALTPSEILTLSGFGGNEEIGCGIAYRTVDDLAFAAEVAGFKAYWARQQSCVIGGGVS